jgi:hypothetical protein
LHGVTIQHERRDLFQATRTRQRPRANHILTIAETTNSHYSQRIQFPDLAPSCGFQNGAQVHACKRKRLQNVLISVLKQSNRRRLTLPKPIIQNLCGRATQEDNDEDCWFAWKLLS